MKGPVQCQEMENNPDFSEYMWMGEEDLDDFDKQVEEELGEEMMMQEALEVFEDQQEAALFAQENLPRPRQRQQRNNHYNGFHGGYPNQMQQQQQYINGYNAPAAVAYPPPPMMGPNAPAGPHRDPAAVAASSSLNPNAPAFVFNPNAPVFVPSWAAAAGDGAATSSTENKEAASTNGSTGQENGSPASAAQ